MSEKISGTPCENVNSIGGGEGYVYVHAGIHGIASLVPAIHDWRNPVAHITIRRVGGDDDDDDDD